MKQDVPEDIIKKTTYVVFLLRYRNVSKNTDRDKDSM